MRLPMAPQCVILLPPLARGLLLPKVMKSLIPLAWVIGLLLVGCGREDALLSGVRLEPTYSSLKATIFGPRCEKCHSGGEPAGRIDLSTYDAMMGGPVVIRPGSPGTSRLYKAVATGRMPKRGTKLSPTELQAVESWILRGAKND
jgi:hypothetical protein